MGESPARPERVDFDDHARFDRWAQDPTGRWFHLQGIKTLAVSGPILIGTENGPHANALLRAVNAVLTRLQGTGTSERCLLTVFRVGKKRERPVWGCWMDWDAGRAEAADVAADIRAGTFDPDTRHAD